MHDRCSDSVDITHKLLIQYYILYKCFTSCFITRFAHCHSLLHFWSCIPHVVESNFKSNLILLN